LYTTPIYYGPYVQRTLEKRVRKKEMDSHSATKELKHYDDIYEQCEAK
jgi:hypothetical protein